MTALDRLLTPDPVSDAPTPFVESDSVHRWYRTIMGFDWRLVQHLIDRLSIKPGHLVLDPFCGAGTTLVQCKKNGIASVGIDANPVCTMATRVKTSWSLRPDEVAEQLAIVLEAAKNTWRSDDVEADPALRYLLDSGMIDRGWLSLHKARKVMSLRAAIDATPVKQGPRGFLRLALVSALVNQIADIKFGPEVYCLREPKRSQVFRSFEGQARQMIDDLQSAQRTSAGPRAMVYLGDSRLADVLRQAAPEGADFVITSPPYPNEHDYTRCTRLELVVLGHVHDIHDLRRLKQRMVRCNTKGLYKTDVDSQLIARYRRVQRVARTLDQRAARHTDRFSLLYGTMVREYFGGMLSHLRSAMRALRPGGRCAYVVSDQQSLLGVHLDTPGILSSLATSRSQGFRLQEVIEWKRTRGSTGTRTLSERIVVLRKAG